MQLTLRGTRLVDATMDTANSDITINNAHIQSIGHAHSVEQNIIEARDAIITPGFIEVHTHGGGGFNLHTTDVQEIFSYAHWIPKTGVTSFLIAVIGTPHALPEAQLQTAVTAIEQFETEPGCESAAEPLDIHLEGPYISEKRRGAHPPSWLRVPNEHETERVLELTKGYLRLITVAPELPDAEKMIRRLIEAGVTVSMGHTDVNYEQAQAAIRLGITHATHCFNAMRPLLHREPGPIAAIAQAPQVFGELIADGMHVHPAMMDILVKILGPERTIVVTDAQAPTGLAHGTFEFGGQEVRVIRGVARLADGTLAGSMLTMDKALRNILETTHVSLQQAIGMLTLNAARSAQIDKRKGKLSVGYDADLLIFDNSLTLQATICRGNVAFATDAWHERLKNI
jgi:N-acetylglucosamine-6-phosphate deacetylase